MRRFLLLLACFLVIPSGPSQARPIDIDDLWSLRWIAAPEVAADGSFLIVPVLRFDMDANAGAADLWRITLSGTDSGAQRLTTDPAHDSHPALSPDATQLAFLSNRDGKSAQIWLLPLAGGEARPLTRLPVAVTRIAWRPDGRSLVFEASSYGDLGADFAAVGQRLEAARSDPVRARISEDRLVRYQDRYPSDGLSPQLFLLEFEGSRISHLLPDFGQMPGLDGFEWDLSADGERIVLSANQSLPPYRVLNYGLFELNIASREVRNLGAGIPAHDTRPQYHPDGRRLLFLRKHRPAHGSDIAQLMIRDAQGERALIPSLQDPVHEWRWVENGRSLLLAVEQRGRINLLHWRPNWTEPRLLQRGGYHADLRALGRDAAVFVQHRLDQVPELAVLKFSTGVVQSLTRFNQARVRRFELGEVRDIEYPGADGQPIQAFLVHPPNFDAQRRHPVLMIVHGGPFVAWLDQFSHGWNPQLLAAAGYVVMMPNVAGSTGFGQDFADRLLGEHAGPSSQDLHAALQWLDQQSWSDPQRYAIAGGSYGGYLAQWMSAETPRFRAVINHAGVFDLAAQFGSDRSWDRAVNYGAAPWTDPQHLYRWSLGQAVPRMQTPTLILHGQQDFRVPEAQSLQLHGSLVGKGVPSRIVLFPTEQHAISRPQTSRLWYAEIANWLQRWVKENPETAD